MKKLILLLLCCYGSAFAQETVKQTLQFTVTGEVEKATVINLDTLNQYSVKDIGNINVTDHTGKFKHKDDQLKGVLLKDVLSHTIYKTASPKLLSRFYFVCSAADGYKVVYSWNEIYNTPVGDHIFIIMQKNGIKAGSMPESLQMTSAIDFKTGRRYLHNLDKIIVGQVQ